MVVDLAVEHDDVAPVVTQHRLPARCHVLEGQSVMIQPDPVEQQFPVFGIAAVGDTLALGRMGVPEEVADVVLFCASPLARWVSGCTIPVHGGGDRPSYLGASTGEVAQRP